MAPVVGDFVNSTIVEIHFFVHFLVYLPSFFSSFFGRVCYELSAKKRGLLGREGGFEDK